MKEALMYPPIARPTIAITDRGQQEQHCQAAAIASGRRAVSGRSCKNHIETVGHEPLRHPLQCVASLQRRQRNTRKSDRRCHC